MATRRDGWLFDAGNTLVFLDHAVVGDLAGVSGSAVRAAEGPAKRRYEQELRGGLGHADGWHVFMATLLEEAGADAPEEAARVLAEEHARFNLWRRVPEGLPDALRRAKARGARLGVVSNSEGALPALFDRVDLSGIFETIVDSARVGVSKPDPRIFRTALERMQLEHATYVGDLPDVDIKGARRAGLDAILLDPLGFYPEHPGRETDIVALVDRI